METPNPKSEAPPSDLPLRLKATVVTPRLALKRPYRPGETIADKYQLQELLGEGGMGAVWRAHNSTLEIDVAVKLIRAEEAAAPDGHELGHRLLQEARAAAQLGHPAITRVFDFGTSDRGDPFIVMELLQGEDLAQALGRRGRIVATRAVALVLPILHALAAAHQKGIVHRDIKPENIFLSRAEDGRTQPKLVDFGIAKMDRGKATHRLTQTGAMLGSPIYMSPEQARGDDVDHLADVWAVCVVLFEMVTGRPPFEGKNYNALLYSIIADDPPPITAFGGGDEELWLLLKRGLEKDPDKRWSGVRELGMALSQWLIARGVHEDVTGASLSAQWLRILSANDAFVSTAPGSWAASVHPAANAPTLRRKRGAGARVLGLPMTVGVGARLFWGALAASAVALLWFTLGPREPELVLEPPPPTTDERLPPVTLVRRSGLAQTEGTEPVAPLSSDAAESVVPEGSSPQAAPSPRPVRSRAIRPISGRQLKDPFKRGSH